jgi:flagella basal body P-ring formation protein FlgA
MVNFSSLLMRCVLVVAACLSAVVVPLARAQTAGGAQSSSIYERAQAWLDRAVNDTGSLPLRMAVEVGALDSRLKLAACERVEPYLPPGTQLWGKTRLGLRCAQGAVKWNVFLPITVKAFGTAWVIKGQVASGAVLTQADAMQMEVDWAENRNAVVANLDDWIGQTATRALTTGQTLRQDMVKASQVFQAGSQVRVVARGPGFEIFSSAQAISSGVMGQVVRVRMDNGRVVSGLVVDSQTVRLEM